MYERTYGTRYNEAKSTKEIALIIRNDIKAAIKGGILPKGLKTSVRYKSFTGGCSIDIRVTDFPLSTWHEFSRTRWWSDEIGYQGYEHNDISGKFYWRYQPCIGECLRWLENLRTSFNHDGSEIQSDYFDVRYYGGTDISGNQDKWTPELNLWLESQRKAA